MEMNILNGIIKQRQKLKLSQADVAEKLQVSQVAVSMWETGEAMPRADKLPELAKILQCDIAELFDESA